MLKFNIPTQDGVPKMAPPYLMKRRNKKRSIILMIILSVGGLFL